MKLQIHRLGADERFVDLVDGIANERNELDKIAGSEKKLVLRTINDLPAFCSAAVSPSRRVTNLWDAEGRLYLTRDASKHFMRSFVMDSEAGAYIEKRSSKALADLTNVLPSRLSELMIGQAIPSTSWGANLHNLLSDTDWNALRASTFAASCYRCGICGTSNGLECHELWRYDEPFPRTPRSSGTDFGGKENTFERESARQLAGSQHKEEICQLGKWIVHTLMRRRNTRSKLSTLRIRPHPL